MGKKLAVIGHPIGHSMSPFIHERLFTYSGVAGSYESLDIPPEALAGRMPELRALDGFNITIPHKQAILPFLDELDAVAAKYGAVNTVVKRDGRWIGCNTDAFGFVNALRLAKIPLNGRILLCGSGGAARTIALECILRGCVLTLAVRDPMGARTQTLLREIEQLGGRAEVRPLSDVNGRFDLAVNATPLGMYPHNDSCPLCAAQLSGVAAVFDAVYNPAETKLIRLAQSLGLLCVNGMGMLVLQAAEAHRLWYGATFSDQQLTALIADATAELNRRFHP